MTTRTEAMERTNRWLIGQCVCPMTECPACILADELKSLYAQTKRIAKFEAALNEIAAWHDGPEVGSHFDEPGSAAIARRALEQR